MTEPHSAGPSNTRRPDPSREPATIDLKATVLDEPAGGPAPAAADPAAAGAATGPEPETPVGDASEPPVGEEPAVQTAAAPGREPRRFGAGALAAAGLLGGLAGAGAFLVAEAWRSPTDDVGARLAQIEGQLGMAPGRDAVQRLERRVDGLVSAQAEAGERLRAARAAADASAARVDAASQQAGQALQRAEAVLAQTEAAANRPAADAAQAAAVADLTGRVAALETQTREGLQAAEAEGPALERRLADAVQQLEGRIGEAVQRLEQRIAGQDQQIAGLAHQLSERGSGPAAASARLVLTNRVRDALRDGASYADSLAVLRRLEADPSRLAALEPFAQGGAPTGKALAQAFRPVAERIVQDQRGEPQSWSNRLLNLADRVVTVRSVNDAEAPGLPGIVARIEAALDRGAFADALSAWQSLPEPARQASDEWGQRLQQRVAASEAVDRLSAEALAALDASTR